MTHGYLYNMNTCVPIVLFVYNRPTHTRCTIESLLTNALSRDSDLYIFSDAPKQKADVDRVREVRKYIRSISGFNKINIVEQPINLGLAQSIISGVTSVINRYGRSIVLEDDLLISPLFLEAMNYCLVHFQEDERVFSIGGYTPAFKIPISYSDRWFLSYRCCTWGWATWESRWKKVDWEVRDYKDFLGCMQSRERFNRGGQDMERLLEMQMTGKIDSWAIRWDYAHFKHDSFCLRPINPLVANTGNDGSGVHCGVTGKYDVTLNSTDQNLPVGGQINLNEAINKKFATFYDGRARV